MNGLHPIAEIAMIERQNYLKMKQHLQYLQEVQQLNPASLDRYRFYLRHLLLWADATDFGHAAEIRPTLPAYLVTIPIIGHLPHAIECIWKDVLASRWALLRQPIISIQLGVIAIGEHLHQPRRLV
jgi:hypothetical protein